MSSQSSPDPCFICLKIVPSTSRQTALKDTNASTEVNTKLFAAFLDCFSQSASAAGDSTDILNALPDTENVPRICDLCRIWLEEWCQVSSEISALMCRLTQLKACLTCVILDRKTVKSEPNEDQGPDQVIQLVGSIRKRLKTEFNVRVQVEKLDKSLIPTKRPRRNETDGDSDSEIIIHENSADFDSDWVYDIAPASPESSNTEAPHSIPVKRRPGRPRTKPRSVPVPRERRRNRPMQSYRNHYTGDAQRISPTQYLFMNKFLVDILDGHSKFRCATCGSQYTRGRNCFVHIRKVHLKNSKKPSGAGRTDVSNLPSTDTVTTGEIESPGNKEEDNVTDSGNTLPQDTTTEEGTETAAFSGRVTRRSCRKILPDFVMLEDAADEAEGGSHSQGDDDDWKPDTGGGEDVHSDGGSSDEEGGSEAEGRISVGQRWYIPGDDEFIDALVPVEGTNNTEFTYMGNYRATLKTDGRFHCGTCKNTMKTAAGTAEHIHFRHYKKLLRRLPPGIEQTEPGKYIYAGKHTFRQEEENKFRCDVCGYVITTFWMMKQHMKRYHCVGAEQTNEPIQSTDFVEALLNPPELYQQSQNTGTDSHPVSMETSQSSIAVVAASSEEAQEEGKRHKWKEMTPCGPNEFMYGGKYKCHRLDGGEVMCGECGLVFRKTHGLLGHIEFVHFGTKYKGDYKVERLSDGRYKCLTCDRVLKHIKTMRRHFKISHLGIKPPPQKSKSKGLKVFYKAKEIEPGVLFEAGGFRYRFDALEQRWFCLHCSATRRTRRQMQAHITTDHINSAEKYMCETCGKEFASYDSLRGHTKRHLGKKHKCGQCGKAFNTKDDLGGHMRIHQGDEAKKLVCETCGKRFYKQNQLVKHRLSHTGATDPYPCEHCDEGFKYLTERRKHVRQEHPETLSYLGSTDEVQNAVNSLMTAECVEKEASDNSATGEAVQGSSSAAVEAVDEDQLVDFKLVNV